MQVNSVPGSATAPRVAMDSTGAFLVAWQQSGGPSDEVFARRFTSAGAAIGTEFRVNTFTTNNQIRPAIAASPGGRFVIAWQSRGQDGSGYGVFARRACQTLAGDGTGNGAIAVGDVFFLINYLFAGGPTPATGADANGDGSINVQDVFFLINFLFAGGPPPACA